MKAKDFDARFDRGEDITGELDLDTLRRPNLEQRRVNVDFPIWMIDALDREARRLGVTRQSLIKVKMAEAIAAFEGLAELGGTEPNAQPAPRRRFGPEAGD